MGLHRAKSRLFISVLGVLLMTGCYQNQVGHGPHLDPPKAGHEDRVNSANPSDNPTPSPSSEKDHLQLSEATDHQTVSESEAQDQGLKVPKKTNSANEQDSTALSLLDLRIRDSITTVIMKLGVPIEQYNIEESGGPITIYEYEHYTVGINQYKQLEFVEVYSASVDPHLQGLRLDDSVKKIIEVLGEPQSQSSFVLSYYDNGSILKFDVDPKMDKILSIKLFAAQ